MNAPVNELLYAGAVHIEMDSTSLVVLALFTLLFLALRKLVFHPFLEDVDRRESKTVKMRETAEELEARAEGLREKHHAAVEAATQEAQEARRTLRVEGLHDKEGRISEAQATAQAKYESQSKKLNDQFDSARESALSQADDLAKSIAAKVLGRAVVWMLAMGASSYVFLGEAFASGDAKTDTYLFDLANQAATLLVFVGLIIFLAGSKIKASLQSRADSLAAEIAAAQSAHDDAQSLLNKYESMINELESERISLLETYRKQGEDEKTKLIEEGKAEAERAAKDAERVAENELTSMQRKIEQELVDLSLARAEELIVKKLNITDHTRLNQSYLSELDKLARG